MAVSRIAYPAAFQPEAGGALTVTFRDLPGAVTFGAGLKAALEAARDCLDEALSFRIARRLDVPAPSARRRGERLVAPPALAAAKLALYYQISLITTHRDRAGDPSGHGAGRREAAGPAGHRQGFTTPSPIRPQPVSPRDL